DRLLSISDPPEHMIALWDSKRHSLIASSPLGTDIMCDCDRSSGAINIKAAGEYQTFFKARYVVSLLHNRQGDLVTGDSNGNVYVWGGGGNLITNYIKHAHEGPVFSLCLYRGWLLNRRSRRRPPCWQWGRNMDRVSELRLPVTEGAPGAFAPHRGAEVDRLIVGTTANSMLDCPLCPEPGLAPLEGVAFGDVPITQEPESGAGHESLFITAGYDSQVCIFNADNHSSVQKTVLKQKRPFAVGGSDGRVHFLRFLPTEEDPTVRAWQPAGQLLATRHGVDALDFAEDFIDESLIVCATNTSDATNFCLLEDEEKVRDVRWKTHNFLFAYYNVGAWNSKSSQESSITSVDVCIERELLAAYCHTFVGPTKITALKFTSDGRHLISIGGRDACVMQWRLTKKTVDFITLAIIGRLINN
uniref:WD_REPEATS_REGION domain-containing protein n=1 Tax=Macrostomum lignano TaxID=282301 RepID=A0A1I8F5F9_9PLAT